MKRLIPYIVCLSAVALLGARALAATLEWSYTLGAGSYCLQTLADGNGGCAIVTVEAGAYKVIWFDKKGAVRYSKSGITGSMPALIACEKNVLVFCYFGASNYQVANVDNKGAETTTSAPNTHYLTYPGVIGDVKAQRLHDRKGYFVERYDVPTTVVTLERYSYK